MRAHAMPCLPQLRPKTLANEVKQSDEEWAARPPVNEPHWREQVGLH